MSNRHLLLLLVLFISQDLSLFFINVKITAIGIQITKRYVKKNLDKKTNIQWVQRFFF